MRKTEIYEFNMPDQEDFYNVEDFNTNAQKTEEAIVDAKSYADGLIEKLVGSAPEALDTIYELSEAIQENETIVDALNEAISKKLDKTDTRRGSRVASVSGNYIDIEIDNTSGANAAYASIGNMTEETSSICVIGCTMLNSNKIRVFFNKTLQSTLLRINYFVMRTQE